MSNYSDADKLKCIEREIELRKRVYGRQVLNGRMSKGAAEREIATMEDIANDYRQRMGEHR